MFFCLQRGRKKIIFNFFTNMSAEKYKQAWEKFQNKMASLKKRRHEILKNISEKLDKQHIEAIRKQMKNYE